MAGLFQLPQGIGLPIQQFPNAGGITLHCTGQRRQPIHLFRRDIGDRELCFIDMRG
jgi:hypothetical protein